MRLDYWGGWYRFDCPKEQSELVRKAGFFKDPKGYWLTRDVYAALRLWHYSTIECRQAITEHIGEMQRQIANSFAEDAPGVDFPVPEGLSLLPYQRAGVAYMMEHENVLLGDDMGLGKTIQAIVWLNSLGIKNALIVCPASLKLNWAKELKTWLTLPLTYGVAMPGHWPLSDIVIINYELLKKCEIPIHKRTWDALIGDEAHYVKNKRAARSKAFYAIPHNHSAALTGTPVPNRPVEVFPILNWLDAEQFPSERAFAQRYGNNENLDELRSRMRGSVMVRRKKSRVLKDLPPKRRQIIELPLSGGIEELIAEEVRAYANKQEVIESLKAAAARAKETKDYEGHKEAVKKLRDEVMVAFSEMSQLRAKITKAKVPYAISHLEDVLATEQKVIVFAYHKSAMDKLEEHFGYRCVKIHGDTKQKDRDDAVTQFQENPSIELFIGSFLAAGTGLTLTASSHVVFLELDWRPYVLTQAEDRAHRIGQKESVLVQHILFEKSLDAKMAQRIVQKQEVIDKVLDDGTD